MASGGFGWLGFQWGPCWMSAAGSRRSSIAIYRYLEKFLGSLINRTTQRFVTLYQAIEL